MGYRGLQGVTMGYRGLASQTEQRLISLKKNKEEFGVHHRKNC